MLSIERNKQKEKQQKNLLRKEFIHNLHINKSDVDSPLVYVNVEKDLISEYGSKEKILDIVENYILSKDRYCNSYYYAGNIWAQNKVENSKYIKKIRFIMGAIDLLVKDNSGNYIVTNDELCIIYSNIAGHTIAKIAKELNRKMEKELELKIPPDIKKEEFIAGLNRIVHYTNNGIICYITTFKTERGLQENRENNKNLKNDISALGYGFIQLTGEYKEKEKIKTEESFCVIDNKFLKKKKEDELLQENKNFVNNILMLSRKYEINSILIRFYLGKEQYQLAWLKQDCTVEKIVLSDVSLNTIDDYLAQIYNKNFVLKKVDYRYENGESGSGFMKAMLFDLFMHNAKKKNFWKK